MSFKKSISIFLIATFCLSPLSAKEPDARTVKAIERNMKLMKTPEKNLKKMAVSKLYVTTNFLREVAKLEKAAKSLVKIKHPAKDFNELSDELVEYLGKLKAAIGKKDTKEAAKNWGYVKDICNDCHGAYKD